MRWDNRGCLKDILKWLFASLLILAHNYRLTFLSPPVGINLCRLSFKWVLNGLLSCHHHFCPKLWQPANRVSWPQDYLFFLNKPFNVTSSWHKAGKVIWWNEARQDSAFTKVQWRWKIKGAVPPIRAESVRMALTKGWPEPTEPEWSTVEERREGKEEMTETPPKNIKGQREQ